MKNKVIRQLEETVNIEKVMHEMEWTTVCYFHPGAEHADWPDRWAVGEWTGEQGDLLCLKRCKTNMEAEAYLSPCRSTIQEACEAAYNKAKLLGLTAKEFSRDRAST